MKLIILIFPLIFFFQNNLLAQSNNFNDTIGVVWEGTDSVLSVYDIATYCAPVLWFSEDEPDLHGKKGKDIDIPRPISFDPNPDKSKPVIYYQMFKIENKNGSIQPTLLDINDSTEIKISEIDKFVMQYIQSYSGFMPAGYSKENKVIGMTLKVVSENNFHKIILTHVNTTFDITETLVYFNEENDLQRSQTAIILPFNLLVLEDLHYLYQDRNGDKKATIFDYSEYQIFDPKQVDVQSDSMPIAKERKDEYKILPPLPENSPYREKINQDTAKCVTYFLRPMLNINYEDKYGIIWEGTDSILSISNIAAYSAPVLWFSEDEPELYGKMGKEINSPKPIPFDSYKDTSRPVIYFRVSKIEENHGHVNPYFIDNYGVQNINLRSIDKLVIQYVEYYEYTEQYTECLITLRVIKTVDDSMNSIFNLSIEDVYSNNVIEGSRRHFSSYSRTLEYHQVPFNLLILENKHFPYCDENGDHKSTNLDRTSYVVYDKSQPDVQKDGRPISKKRKNEYKILPPLPGDSRLFEKIMKDTVDNIVYILRPMPAFIEEGDTSKQFVLWNGYQSVMSIKELASYCAPIFWYSSDEPELNNNSKRDICIPTFYKFKNSSRNFLNSPVVYYQIRSVETSDSSVKLNYFYTDNDNIEDNTVYFPFFEKFEIDYIHFYDNEKGPNGHIYDTEEVQFIVRIVKQRNFGLTFYKLILEKVIAKAHANDWYDNIYIVDKSNTELKLPFHILVEEGKHASCTDVNGDGYYSPGYDVNVNTDDAWGVRDVIRTGRLFSPQYESWMSKKRDSDYQVIPPLPFDSPHRKKLPSNNAKYELRPMPSVDSAIGNEALQNDMKSYTLEKWPLIDKPFSYQKDLISVAFRNDFKSGLIVTGLIPIMPELFGGFVSLRFYFGSTPFTNFNESKSDKAVSVGSYLMYTPSASRYFDPYFSTGLDVKENSNLDFVCETGIKIRANIGFSHFFLVKWMSALTDLWGIRVGVKSTILRKQNIYNFIFEFGGGLL